MTSRTMRRSVYLIATFAFALAARADDLHIKKNISVDGNSISSAETWIKGARERTVNGSTATLRQNDLKRTITINYQTQSYVLAIDPLDENAARAAALATGVPAQAGGKVILTWSITDTNERKQMFGYQSRHLKSTLAIEPSAASCYKTSQKFEIDGWYADIFESQAGHTTWSGFKPPVQMAEGCQDRVVLHDTGNGKSGYPLVESITLHNPDGSTTELKFETTEITKETLDASLFDVPPGYRQVSSVAELQGPAPAGQQGAAAQSPLAALQAQPTLPGANNTQAMMQQTMLTGRQASQAGPMGMRLPGMGGNPMTTMQMAGQGGQQQPVAAPVAAPKELGPKAPGKIRIGVASPDAQVGQGSTAGDYSTPIRNSVVLFMDGPAVEVAALDARTPIQLQAEAQQKQCDYVLYSSVTVKRTSGGGFGKWMKVAVPVATNMTPVAIIAHGMGSPMAAQAAASAAAMTAQQQAMSQLAGFNSQIKQKDNVTVQYQLVPAGQTTPQLQNTLEAKAKSDGEDVLTPLIQQTANTVLAEVTKK